jgi:hypothetical protein
MVMIGGLQFMPLTTKLKKKISLGINEKITDGK